MGLLDSPAPGSMPAPRTPGLLASSPRRMSLQEWMAKDAAYRAAHPDEAPEGWSDDVNVGGDKAGKGGNEDPSRDLRSFAGLGDYFNDFDVRNDLSNLAGMSGVGALFGGAIRDMTGWGKEAYGPTMPAFGLNDAVADEIAQAAGGGGASPGPQIAGPEPSAPGLFAKGGKVGRKGLLDMDPPGPDNVVIGAKTGERILNEKQFGSLSKEARAEVERVLKAKK
jgi:hypothetical protein